MYVVYSICLYFFCRFFCSHTIKIIFPKKKDYFLNYFFDKILAKYSLKRTKLHLFQGCGQVQLTKYSSTPSTPSISSTSTGQVLIF